MKVKIMGKLLDVKEIKRQTKEGKEFVKTMLVVYSGGELVRIYTGNKVELYLNYLNKEVEIETNLFMNNNKLVIAMSKNSLVK